MSAVDDLLESRMNKKTIADIPKTPNYSLEEKLEYVLAQYTSAKIQKDKPTMDLIIGTLEEGIIQINQYGYKNESEANIILKELIKLDHPVDSIEIPSMPTLEYPAPVEVDDEWVTEVKEGIRRYADELLYDACIMWCEALDWDRKMCAPIVKGSNDFFRQIEALGYPHLCLLIKAAK